MTFSQRLLPAALVLCGVAWCSLSTSWSADESSRILFSRLSEAEGFDAESVNAITEDERGMIWLATDQGLSRFDGAGTLEFKNDPNDITSLSSNRISSLAFGPQGKLWVGTADAGLNRFDPITLTNERLPFQSHAGNNALRSDGITGLTVIDKQFLLIGTRSGLGILHFQSGKIQPAAGISDGTLITQIFKRSDDLVLASSESGKLYQWDPATSKFDLIWKTGTPVSAIAAAPGNEVWVGTMGQGLLRLNLETKQVTPTTLKTRDITSVHTDTNGNLWVGTTDGLAHLERGSFEFSLYRNNPADSTSLSSNLVACLFESRAKVLWVGTTDGSANRFGLNRSWFPQYLSNPGKPLPERLPHDSIWSMAPAGGKNLWIGTESGLTLWNADRETYATPDLGPDIGSPYVSAIIKDSDGTVWAGTKGNGLIVMPDGDASRAFQLRHQNGTPGTLGHDYISALFEDSRSALWVGTHGGGLWRLEADGRTFSEVTVQAPGDPEGTPGSSRARFIAAITEDQAGRICVATSDGLYGIPSDKSELVPYQHFVTFAQPLSGKAMSSVLRGPDDSLFVGTPEKGLLRISPDGAGIRVISRSNSDLPSDRILGLLGDREALIWITTANGITRYDPSKEEFRNFDDLDGLQNGTLHLNTCALAGDGALYFGGGQGFHRIDTHSLPLPRQPPTPILTGFDRFGVPVTPRPGGILEKSIAATSEVRMPYDRRNRFAFHFANLSTDSPFRGEFRYQLIGYEDDWQMAKGNHKASYPAILPGRYEFRVQSSPDGLKWNANQAQVRLVIPPPWWQTWWALTIFTVITLAIGAIVFWSLRRAQMQKMQQRERKLRSQRDKAEAQLAAQLQNAVLLERTSHSFNDSVHQGNVFEEPLKNLANHYEVDRCLLCRLEHDAGRDIDQLVAIGEYRVGEEVAALDLVISTADPFVQDILNAEAPIQRDNTLAIRTSFQSLPNGVLLVDGTGRQRRQRAEEEINLLQSVAIQFGIAIAQQNLTLKEDSYRHQLEQARLAAENANQAKTSFLARMTHDLRTPLSAMLGFTRLFQEDNTLSEQQRETINIISDSGEHLLSVINDSLDVAKIEAGKIEINAESFELLPLLRGIREILKGKIESKGLSFDLSAVTSIPQMVAADRGKLRQILVNLLGNAIKFTDQGSISLKVASRAEPAGEGAADADAQLRLFFQVSDTGRGIAEKDFPKLFQEFSQTDSGRGAEESTGLGLSIAKSFCNLLGGDIKVSSEVGVGTTFEFSILCKEVAASATPEPAEPVTTSTDSPAIESQQRSSSGHSPSPADFRILIVDDEKMNRLLLRKILGRLGFELTEAADGEEACAQWRETQPHLILMDENMPSMKGSEASRIIRQECRHGKQPVMISLTANAFAEAQKAAIDAGFADFIAKPFDKAELIEKISRHLGLTDSDSKAQSGPVVASFPPAVTLQ